MIDIYKEIDKFMFDLQIETINNVAVHFGLPLEYDFRLHRFDISYTCTFEGGLSQAEFFRTIYHRWSGIPDEKIQYTIKDNYEHYLNLPKRHKESIDVFLLMAQK